MKIHLYQIVKKLSLDYLTSLGRKVDFDDQKICSDEETCEKYLQRIIFDTLTRIIFSEIKHLKLTVRNIFKCSFVDGLIVKEISKQTQIPKKEVWNRYNNAVHSLVTKFSGHFFATNVVWMKTVCLGIMSEDNVIRLNRKSIKYICTSEFPSIRFCLQNKTSFCLNSD